MTPVTNGNKHITVHVSEKVYPIQYRYHDSTMYSDLCCGDWDYFKFASLRRVFLVLLRSCKLVAVLSLSGMMSLSGTMYLQSCTFQETG